MTRYIRGPVESQFLIYSKNRAGKHPPSISSGRSSRPFSHYQVFFTRFRIDHSRRGRRRWAPCPPSLFLLCSWRLFTLVKPGGPRKAWAREWCSHGGGFSNRDGMIFGSTGRKSRAGPTQRLARWEPCRFQFLDNRRHFGRAGGTNELSPERYVEIGINLR